MRKKRINPDADTVGNRPTPPVRIETRDVADLQPAPYNPRRISEDALRGLTASVRRFGLVQPIIVNERTGHVVGGHQRVKALQAIGQTETPVVVVDLPATEEKALNVALNSPAISGVFTEDLDALLAEVQGELPELYDDLMLGALLRAVAPDAGVAPASQAYPTEDVVEEAFAWFRASGFPYRKLTRHECMQEINALRALSGDEMLSSRIGYHVADTYHPHRFHASAYRMRSPFDAFNSDVDMRRALEWAMERQSVGTDYFSTLNIVRGTQSCSNFRPAFAAYMYRRFCPPGGTVLDTSTGYGGRLVGAAGSGVVAEYIGIDPNTVTHASNERMSSDLRLPLKVELHNLPAEDVAPEVVQGRCDFSFTSPPYFSKERYSDEETQSWCRYKTCRSWVDGFLVPMMALTHAALKVDSIAVVNIADVKIGAVTHALVDHAKSAAVGVGFDHVGTESFALTSREVNGEDAGVAQEAVLIFRKRDAAQA